MREGAFFNAKNWERFHKRNNKSNSVWEKFKNASECVTWLWIKGKHKAAFIEKVLIHEIKNTINIYLERVNL